LERGKAAFAGGLWSESIDLLIPLVEHDPSSLEANQLLGSALLRIGRPDLAESALFASIHLSNWTDSIAIAELVESLVTNGDLALAEQVGLVGLQRAEDSTGILAFAVGTVHTKLLKWSSAADYFLAAALTQPSNVEAWLRASTLNFPPNQQNYTFAQSVLTKAIESDENNPILLFNFGLALHYDSKVTEAVVFYQEALRVLGEDRALSLDGFFATYATALHQTGNAKEADRLYRLAKLQNPRNVVALANHAILLCTARLREGLVVLATAREVDPGHADYMKAAEVCGRTSMPAEGGEEL